MSEEEPEGQYLYASFLYYDEGNAIVFATILEVKKICLPQIMEAVKGSTGGQDATLLGLIPISREEMLHYQQYMNSLAKEKAVKFKPQGRTC